MNTGPSQLSELSGSKRSIRPGAERVGPADPDEIILVSIYVRAKTGSPPLPDIDTYSAIPLAKREYLTRDELAERYGAAEEDLKAVVDFAAAAGLTVVMTDAARQLVQVSGSANKIAAAFGVELGQYRSPTETYRGYEGTLNVPQNLAPIVIAVLGLDNRRMAQRAGGSSNGCPSGLTPPEVAYAYNFPAPEKGAKGQTIAILEFSGPPPQPSCGFAQSDLDAFIADLNTSPPPGYIPGSPWAPLKSTTVKVVPIPNSLGDVMGGSASNPSDTDEEVALDVQVAVSVAQHANVVLYFAPFTDQGWADALTTIIHDKANDPSVISISWDWTENKPEPDGSVDWTSQTIGVVSQALKRAAHLGITVMVASGDDGTNCQIGDGQVHVYYPASDPWVTACGGTEITSYEPLSEKAWSGSGGGLSYLNGVPSWQKKVSLPASLNIDGHRGRGLPDVAGNASLASGYKLWLYGQPVGPVWGTSAVAPLYAALVAILNATLKKRAGFLNSFLYAHGKSAIFRDMGPGVSNAVEGVSPGYESARGWDAVTGWGVINGSNLLCALSNELYGVAKVAKFSAAWEDSFTQLTWTMKAGAIATGFVIKRYVGEYSPSANPDMTADFSSSGPLISLKQVYDDVSETQPDTTYQYRLVVKNFSGESEPVVSNKIHTPAAVTVSSGSGGSSPGHPIDPNHSIG